MGIYFDDARLGKAKMWLKTLAIAVCAVFVCAQAWAAAAIAYDHQSGISGHGIGINKATASAAAIDDAKNNGAANPKFWFWYALGGWGSVAFSDDGGGAWTIGGALGYSTKRKAKKRAKRECKDAGGINCRTVDIFKDNIGTGKQFGGASYHASSN